MFDQKLFDETSGGKSLLRKWFCNPKKVSTKFFKAFMEIIDKKCDFLLVIEERIIVPSNIFDKKLSIKILGGKNFSRKLFHKHNKFSNKTFSRYYGNSW